MYFLQVPICRTETPVVSRFEKERKRVSGTRLLSPYTSYLHTKGKLTKFYRDLGIGETHVRVVIFLLPLPFLSREGPTQSIETCRKELQGECKDESKVTDYISGPESCNVFFDPLL